MRCCRADWRAVLVLQPLTSEIDVGTSTDALLWYGVAGGERSDCFDEDVLARLFDCEVDAVFYEGWVESLDGILAEYGCELIIHCSYSYPGYGIAIKARSFSAIRGYPERATQKPPTARQRKKLAEAMKAVGWQGDDSVGWNLASLWGT